MSIVVNGTTIPENVANALNVNGTNITSVVCNGTTVWTQSLNLNWSGSSINAWGYGIETSGSNYAYKVGSNYGSWQSVGIDGIFSGNSTISTAQGIQGFSVSGSNIRTVFVNKYSSTWASYSLVLKSFSGSSLARVIVEGIADYCLDTSGGLIRYRYTVDGTEVSGPYISLT